jgi:protein-tyrosine phosphatase
MSFEVLFVCTGNICRSPAAERLFRAGLRTGALLTVTSAGTSGLTGYPIDGRTARALQELGIDTDGHRARRVERQMLRASDLVLTAAIEHRAAVLRAEPSLLSRAFTLREFGRLSAESNEARPSVAPTDAELRTRVAAIARQRGLAGPAGPAENDIADPYGAPLEIARATVAQILQEVGVALAGLGLRQEHGPRVRPLTKRG